MRHDVDLVVQASESPILPLRQDPGIHHSIEGLTTKGSCEKVDGALTLQTMSSTFKTTFHTVQPGRKTSMGQRLWARAGSGGGPCVATLQLETAGRLTI